MDDSNDNNLNNLFISNESEDLNKDEFLVTMKIDLSKEKNKIIVPDSISIDKLISIPQKKYLEELSDHKQLELKKFKEKINGNKESFFFFKIGKASDSQFTLDSPYLKIILPERLLAYLMH